MSSANVVICSFYTDDDYYRAHAERLRANLEQLGLAYELQEIHKAPGEQWPDLCRKKIPFMASVRAKHPDKKLFWIDVDCVLTAFPDFIRDFSADIIGFQRSFGSPMDIGYANRSRFWEPAFWGLNNTPQAAKFLADAAAFEQVADVRATDDYFLEETWRTNGADMTYQIIPSNLAYGNGDITGISHQAFFHFGSSGNVKEFAGKVVQHTRKGLRTTALKFAKRVESALPEERRKQLRKLADSSGITARLTARSTATREPARASLLHDLLDASKSGDLPVIKDRQQRFVSQFLARNDEARELRAADAFAHYSTRNSNEEILVAWWSLPHPGNFGDWLSPLIIGHYTDHRLVYQAPADVAKRHHIVGLGSIGRFIKSNSVVVGTGISFEELQLDKQATYCSLRGPITADVLRKSGGPVVESFGDPGIILSRVMPMQRGATNGRVALVRHFTHRRIPLRMPDFIDELEVLAAHPDDIRALLNRLHEYDYVVTTAMHIMIACQSYGIPVALISFEGFEDKVHGTGIKYRDYSLGAGLPAINPVSIGLDLTRITLADLVIDQPVSTAKKDEVEAAVRAAIMSVTHYPVGG